MDQNQSHSLKVIIEEIGRQIETLVSRESRCWIKERGGYGGFYVLGHNLCPVWDCHKLSGMVAG